MTPEDRGLSILDAIAIVSFLVSLANYSENVTQSQLQETIQVAMSDIHKHLHQQDEKLDKLLSVLEKGVNNA